MINTTFNILFYKFIKQLFCLLLIFNVVGKDLIVDIVHESLDFFELCDSNPEEKELDCKEKELEDYDEEKKFLTESTLNLKKHYVHIGCHFYRNNHYFELHTSIVLPPPEYIS